LNLIEAIDGYVKRKRSEGLSYFSSGWYLMALGKRVGNIPLESVTAREVLNFLDGPRTSPGTWMVKYRLLRAFFDFWLARGEIGALPLPAKRKERQRPFVPYIYTHSEIRKLLKAVRGCQKAARCGIDPITLRTVLIFIYGAGTLVGEALRLLIKDVDLKKGSVTIRGNRHNRLRTIPIGLDLTNVLEEYLISRRRQDTTDQHFFLNKRGEALKTRVVDSTFKRLRQVSGIRRHDVSYQPRMYDLRHTFAVHRIAGWIKHGADLNRMLPALSVYMGLVGLRTTEKYLSFTPERFRAQLIQLSPRRGRKRWRDDPELMKFLSHLSEDCGQDRRLNGIRHDPSQQKDSVSGSARTSPVKVMR
jgi:integrase/recombinase XerD